MKKRDLRRYTDEGLKEPVREFNNSFAEVVKKHFSKQKYTANSLKKSV